MIPLLLLVRALLALLPFATALRVVNSWARLPRRQEAARRDDLDRLVRAVSKVGRRLFPKNPCLTNAVAVYILHRRAGEPTVLRIGVRRGPSRELEAHAWVELEGSVIIGGRDAASQYIPLPDVGPVAASEAAIGRPLRSGPH